ncbi:hypothetical protein OB955_22555 [Halobacteria archaeon AArc-m2/3/4]|uniref:Major facilitator superfamily (MFS) profile domain-containing protein n=1 Tax=Natronoglomus mannanivorans TaxID=2979990 RepID=A0ABT2QKM6_9EURY|nr:hypothetical protein [Halobacteria archaeon AArc-m2/3/4]
MSVRNTSRGLSNNVLAAIQDSIIAKSLGAFVVGSTVLAVLLDLLGYDIMAAIIVAFAIVVTVITILFVAIPVSALSLLD